MTKTAKQQHSPRHQGRILRLHFTCNAPLPYGTTLRVTSSIGPPPENDIPLEDAQFFDDTSSVASGNSLGGPLDTDYLISTVNNGGEGADEKARLHNRLLQNTVEMYTTPETYPVWKTKRPVVVVDEGDMIDDKGNKILLTKGMEDEQQETEGDDKNDNVIIVSGGPLVHRYRYVAVTPGAIIDWSLCTRKELNNATDDGSQSTGRTSRGQTVATLESSDDENEHSQRPRSTTPASVEEGQHDDHEDYSHHDDDDIVDEDDEIMDFPPILYEHPIVPVSNNTGDDSSDMMMIAQSESSGSPPKPIRHHQRVPSVFDGQGNPVDLPGSPLKGVHAESGPSLVGTSIASMASLAISGLGKSPVLTWEGVSALPYRTRTVDSACGTSTTKEGDDMEVSDVDIIDQWNDPNDTTFQKYWEMKQHEKEELATATVKDITTVAKNEDDMDTTQELNEDDDPMDAQEEKEKEGIFIVCYHLPVTMTKDSDTKEWNACWSESLIAKSRKEGVSLLRKTTWIGTVSNIPLPLLQDPNEREAIRKVLEGMNCIPVFFDESPSSNDKSKESLRDRMYLGFCKQVLWPSFHNVDLLDLATNGWGQRQRDTNRSDPVLACAHAAAEAKERKRSGSISEEKNKHSSLNSDWDQRRLDSWWNAYIEVNQKFSQVVADLAKGGDVVWVHDYHLALLPRMLREMRNETDVVHPHGAEGKKLSGGGTGTSHPEHLPGNEIVGGRGKPVRMIFFTHVPFPTSQVFRELEHGEALLEGILHADVVGFHAFDHARHFLNAAKRILGLTYESLVGGLIGVRHRGTKVLVTVSNVSVEADNIEALLEYPKVKEEAEALQKKHEGRSIISGIDVAQRLSGVSYKLLAFERLLTDYPVWQSNVVLLQRCLIPGARRVDEADTIHEVRFLVQRIRKRFGPEVIDYEERVGSVFPIDQRLAIWTSSHVMMHTPVREGLNLLPLEYVFTHKEPADPGVVIASEFSAVSSVLNGALRVNPYDVQMCVTSIDSALSMSVNERDARRVRDIDFVSTCPSGLWTRNVLRDLNDATLQSSKMETIGESSPDSILAREAELGLERLSLLALKHAYANTKTRVFIIDFNGTLVVKEPSGKYLKREILGTSGFKPTHLTTLALQRLSANPKNIVYVVSGDSQPNLEAAVGNIPGLGLAASNGTCFRDPGGRDSTWQYLDFGVDWNAVKKVAMPIISKFTARTNGSFVKLSHSSIGWSYYSCDPEWGSLQASHLVSELEEALHSFDVRFVALKGIVEVVPRKGHKGHIVKKILGDVKARKKDVDFVLCVGDDIADEKMFTSVINFFTGSEEENAYAFNVAVGKKPTNASFYVDDASDVGDILVALSGDAALQRQASSDGSTASGEDFFA